MSHQMSALTTSEGHQEDAVTVPPVTEASKRVTPGAQPMDGRQTESRSAY